MLKHRGSGILLHVTSLAGDRGIGDLGPSARQFIDFLKSAGQSYWQILPVCPSSSAFDYSPYMGLSAFAGNPLLISPDLLVDDGLLLAAEVESLAGFSPYLVAYQEVAQSKEQLFRLAFDRFIARGDVERFQEFCEEQSWLDDYALFTVLRKRFNGACWVDWPRDLATRDRHAIKQALTKSRDEIQYHKFVQYLFFDQWSQMRGYAALNGVKIIGDLPIYVGYDSVDVWVDREFFLLDPLTSRPTHVAGVPPDYFSETGQRWGNPLYRWTISGGGDNETLYSWWRQRFSKNFELVDLLRVDHFRGFDAYWEIPADEETAVNGRWVNGPGISFFMKMARSIGSLPLIAEDLGTITPEVEELRDRLEYPGMKILQFAFDSDTANPYLPHNFVSPNCVVYTGTHDNDTTVGWYLSPKVMETSKAKAKRYAHSDGNLIHQDFIRLAFSSVACLAIVPLQDVLGFGGDCRMNTPSTASGNWRWRCASQFLTDEVASWLREETIFYGRLQREDDR